MEVDPLLQLENFKSFKKRFVGTDRPNIRTAKRKVRSGEWPGIVDGNDVYIYWARWERDMKSPDDPVEARAMDLLGL